MNPEDLKPEEEGIDIPTNPHRGLFARQSGGGQNTDKEGTGGGNQPHGELAANSLEPSSTAEPSPAETEIKLDELEQKKQENVKQMLLSLQASPASLAS